MARERNRKHPHYDEEEGSEEAEEESEDADEEESEAPPLTQTLMKYDSESDSKTLDSAPIIPKSDQYLKDKIDKPVRVKRKCCKHQKVSKGKKTKTSDRDDDPEDKKFGVGKLWSENDEIALLQGMIEFKSETGADPNLNLSQFYVFVDNLLSVHGSKTRLSEKMRRLKNKYKIDIENGSEAVFSKPHDHKLFVLSNKIWGGEAGENDGKVKISRKKDDSFANVSQVKDEDEEVKVTDLLSMFPRLGKAIELEASTYVCVPKDINEYVKEIITSLGEEKARDLEEGWKVIGVMEYELYAKRAEMKFNMKFKQTRAMLDVVKSLES